MNATLTLTLDSAAYIEADRSLRVKQEHFVPGIPDEYARRIIYARRRLGLSMDPVHAVIDYDAEKDPSKRPGLLTPES